MISDSSLESSSRQLDFHGKVVHTAVVRIYAGLTVVIFSPDLASTHSLLIKRPVGWWYFRPLGAVSSTVRFAMATYERMIESVRENLVDC